MTKDVYRAKVGVNNTLHKFFEKYKKMDDQSPEQKFAREIFDRESKDGILELDQLADTLRMTNLVITGQCKRGMGSNLKFSILIFQP